MRALEEGVDGEVMREGVEYARLGQIRRMELEGSSVVAAVQGRRQRSYTVTIGLEPFTPDGRDRLILAMSEQSRYAAKLLAGELPPNIEDLFAPLDMRLFPATAAQARVSCDCAEPRVSGGWCKHAVCVCVLLSERMSADPFLIFALRGLPGDLLIDSLRQKRAIAGLGSGPAPVHVAHVPGASDNASPTLDSLIGDFWQDRGELDDADISMPIEPPAVSHAILRRLGSSPFTESRFRFVGLMATCYDVVSEHVIREQDNAPDIEHQPEHQPVPKADDGSPAASDHPQA